MAIRADISVNWNLSPRIITVASPSTALTMQDLYDTMRDVEYTQMDESYIIAGAGGEPLGGGVLVGLTLTLNNAKVAFEARPGPEYVQCYLTGGNLVSTDINGDPTSAVEPTAFTQIIQSNSSSATQTDLAAIQFASFGGGVTVDETSSNAGTEYPIGNLEYPVNNIADARIIAAHRGFKTMFIRGNIILNGGDNISDFLLQAENATRSTIIINDAALTDNCEIQEAFITGILDNGIIIRKCVIQDLSYLNGVVWNCVLNPGTITLGNNSTGHFLDCFSGVPGTGTPTIDCGGSGQSLAMRNYNGGVKLTNKTGTDSVSIDLNSGQIKLDPDPITGVINGTIVCRGTGKVINADTGEFIPNGISSFNGATIINEMLNPVAVSEAVWDEPIADHTEYGTTGHSMLFQSYRYEVNIDTVNGSAGTLSPIGTHEFPVNNLADALTIAAAHEFQTFRVHGNLVIDGEDIKDMTFLADRSLGNSVTVTSMTNTDSCYFEDLTVSGILSGSVRFTRCVLGEIVNFDGGAKNSLLTDKITITGTGANYLTECDVYITDPAGKTEINIGNTTLNIITCRGGFLLTNKTSINTTAVNLVAGTVEVDPSCISGSIQIKGLVNVIDNSSAGCTVINKGIDNDVIIDGVLDAPLIDHKIDGTTGRALNDVSYTDKLIYVNTELVENGDGKSSSPFNNVSDAVDFAELIGWKKLRFLADATLERTMKNFTIEGIGLVTIDLNGQDVDKSEFIKVRLTGHQVGSITAREVVMLPGLTGVNGVYKESGLAGSIVLATDARVTMASISALFLASPAPYEIDLGVANPSAILNVRKLSGAIAVKNVNTADKFATFEFSGGKFVADDTNTAGAIGVAGLPDTAVNVSALVWAPGYTPSTIKVEVAAET
ncbi:MAG: hypothetical protein U9O94_11425, partial [Nanoarchaeota archaeon]|nr:hypothetical protein [Nanoarchaeota archaeon]